MAQVGCCVTRNTARCLRLHPLKGADRGRWSIWVNGNWRLTFEFRNGQAYVLDYEDYH
jgi:toxin HigB-1